jgi:hypothetical protein
LLFPCLLTIAKLTKTFEFYNIENDGRKLEFGLPLALSLAKIMIDHVTVKTTGFYDFHG